MRAKRRPDGSLVVGEDPTWLRALLLGFGAAAVAAILLQESRDATKLLLGGLGALVPFGGAALLERVRFEFDTAQRRLRWRRRNLFLGLSGELAFTDLADVVVRVRHERSSEHRRAREVPWYRVALVTTSGEDLLLSSRTYADERSQQRIADAIRTALGLPAAEPAQAPLEARIEQLAAAGEVIEAVKLARRRHGHGLAEAKDLVERLRG